MLLGLSQGAELDMCTSVSVWPTQRKELEGFNRGSGISPLFPVSLSVSLLALLCLSLAASSSLNLLSNFFIFYIVAIDGLLYLLHLSVTPANTIDKHQLSKEYYELT